jgi:phosphopantothenoylcysteine decarboxylase / phosphopantothenate---cysteine ligase
MNGKRIILGVSGGIAAYKSVYLLRELQKAGAEVRVVMTPSATRFVGLETFSALTRTAVPVHVFSDATPDDNAWTRHIQWGEWADLMLVAPCTANTLAGLVHGHSDNMLLTTALAIRCPLLLAPTMDGGMYRSPAVRRNLNLARELGFHIIEPDTGYLASGLTDAGRLPEIAVLMQAIQSVLDSAEINEKPIDAVIDNAKGNNEFGKHSLNNPFSKRFCQPQLLSGKKILVTAGPTREFIDAVRFISNPSSGKMGIAMAEAARDLGGEVTLVHGTISEQLPAEVKTISIVSANDLFNLVSEMASEFDVIIMAAAVSDFTPAERVIHKIKKGASDEHLKLIPTPDTLKWLGEHKRAGQLLVGFAMETDNLEAETERKRVAKNADWIAGNLLNTPGSGFQTDDNAIYLKGAVSSYLFRGSKKQIALEMFLSILGTKHL